MKIYRTQFRYILVVYIVVFVLGITVDSLTNSLVPAAVRELEPWLSTQYQFLRLVFCVALLGAGLIVFVGMFCFWSPARHIYLVTVFVKILASPLMGTWSVETGWGSAFGGLELLLDGVILTLCLVGPAKHLFKKQQKESKKPVEATA